MMHLQGGGHWIEGKPGLKLGWKLAIFNGNTLEAKATIVKNKIGYEVKENRSWLFDPDMSNTLHSVQTSPYRYSYNHRLL